MKPGDTINKPWHQGKVKIESSVASRTGEQVWQSSRTMYDLVDGMAQGTLRRQTWVIAYVRLRDARRRSS